MPFKYTSLSLIILATVFYIFSASNTQAALSSSDRKELFSQVETLCKEASSVSEIFEITGAVKAGALLKIVGVKAEGKITKSQLKNIEQRFGEFRTNPVLCRIEMIKLITPLFSINNSPNDYSDLIDVDLVFFKVKIPSDWIVDSSYEGSGLRAYAYSPDVSYELDTSGRYPFKIINPDGPVISTFTLIIPTAKWLSFDNDNNPDQLPGIKYVSSRSFYYEGADSYSFTFDRNNTKIQRTYVTDVNFADDETQMASAIDCVVPQNEWSKYRKLCAKFMNNITYSPTR